MADIIAILFVFLGLVALAAMLTLIGGAAVCYGF